MSLIKSSGLKTAAIATERGWESPDGKLIISSRNLLSNRVSQNLASPEELKRWSEGQLIDIEFRTNKVYEAIEVNQSRLKILEDNFNAIPAVSKLTDANSHIAYLQKKIEHLKIVAEYEKSFKAHNLEVERLNSRRDKIQARLDTVLAVVPKLTEKKSEDPKQAAVVSPEIKENSNTKPVVPAKVEVLEAPKKKRFGPQPGWKERRAERLAAEKAASETKETKTEAPATTIAAYPIAAEEIVND